MRDMHQQRAQRGDLVILQPTRRMTIEEFEELQEELRKQRDAWGKVRVVVLDDGLQVHVVRSGNRIRRRGYTPRWARG